MTRKRQVADWRGLLLATLSFVVIACGNDDGGNGGTAGSGGGGTGTGSAACNSECEMQAAQGCLVVPSVEECKDVCAGLKQLQQASCYEALEASSECRVSSNDVCYTAMPDPCADEFDAIVAGCGM